MGTIEHRAFARIETSIECTAVTGDQDFAAKVANLSRSGAALIGPSGKAVFGDAVMILLERAEGEFSLALPSIVQRVSAQGDEAVYGVRFDAMPPDLEEQLVRLLKVLAKGRGQGRRNSPRVSSRVRVRCKSREAFVATLNDLSRGGLSVRCPRPVEPGGSLSVEFGVEEHPVIVTVSGEILRVNLQGDGSFLVSLKFDPPTMEDRGRVLGLLNVLLGLGPRQGVVIEDDE
jgi:c-di-GMP-binding flagellar brake protein YcgR